LPIYRTKIEIYDLYIEINNRFKTDNPKYSGHLSYYDFQGNIKYDNRYF
jgi:hypothetical protein